MKQVKPNLIDRVVTYFNPHRGANRIRSRLALNALADSGYITPGSARRSVKGWTASLKSPAGDIDRKFDGLKAASRDFSMNSPIATAIFRRNKTNVIGPGLQVQPMIDREFLNMSEDEARRFTDSVIREFDLWATSLECDHEGTRTFAEDQALLLCSSMINGDAFFTLPWVRPKRSDWPYETTIKLIDGDLIQTPSEQWAKNYLNDTTAKIRNGVEFDSDNRLDAFWVADRYSTDVGSVNYTRVPVYNSQGERQFFQVYDPERIGQRRGIPFLAPVVERLKMIARNSEAELMANLVASLFTAVVRDANSGGPMLGEFYNSDQTITGGGSTGNDGQPAAKNSGSEFDLEMGYGNVFYLDNNRQVEIAESRRGRNEYGPYFEAMATEVAAACNLPYDVVMLKFNESYSALRGAVIEATKDFRTRRSQIVSRACQPTYEAIMTEAVLKGRIEAPLFFKDLVYKKAYCRAVWVGLGSGQIDPLKEARAAVLKIRRGLSTREQEYMADKGGRWPPMIERLKAENDLMQLLRIDDGGEDPISGRDDDETKGVGDGD